jgi:hypothetical protein
LVLGWTVALSEGLSIAGARARLATGTFVPSGLRVSEALVFLHSARSG